MRVDNTLSHPIAHACIALDKAMDYIPFISVINNAVDLVAKAALYWLAQNFSSFYARIEESPWVVHLSEKTTFLCLLSSVPFINFFVALERDHPGALKELTISDNDRAFNQQMDEFEQQFERNNQDFTQIVEQMEQDKLERKRQWQESKEQEAIKLQESLRGLRERINQCPNNPEGAQRRQSLERLLQTIESTQESCNQALEELYG